MNEVLKNIKTRRAIRKYQNKPIEEEILNQILEAGIYAPSAGNNQRSMIVCCTNDKINRKLGVLSRNAETFDPNQKKISTDQPSIKDDLTIQDGFYGAPVVCTIFALKMKHMYNDAAVMAQNMMLAAHSLGIGSCFIGRTKKIFESGYGKQLIKEWGIEEDLFPVCHVLLGYVEGEYPPVKPRKEGRIIKIEE